MDTVLVTGGTGSFGQAFVRYLLEHTRWTIRVFSRDEQKQDAMRNALGNDRVRYLLGDVRDEARLSRALRGVDYVVHAAALKIIPAGEYNPDEVIRTNVGGSENVINASIAAGCHSLVCISSDKAVAPVNLYGATKMCMEKLALLSNASSGATRVNVVRYGNVIGSRGSIFTLLKKQAASGHLTITDDRMTRFWMSLDEACDLVFNVLNAEEGGHIYIPHLRSARVLDLYNTLFPGVPVQQVGMRHGEKMHEWLSNEYEVLEDLDWCWRIACEAFGAWRWPRLPIRSDDPALLEPAAQLIARYSKEFNDALAA